MSLFSRTRLVKAAAIALGTTLFAFGGSAAMAQAEQPAQPAQPGGGQPGQPGGGRGNRGGGTPEEREKRMAEFRAQADARMAELLGAKPEEYAVLKPRIEKIQQLQRANDTRQAGRGLLFGQNGQGQNWRNRPSGVGEGQRADAPAPAAGATAGAATEAPAMTKAKELTTAVQNKDTDPAALKTKLAELRAAKTAADAEVTKLQGELKTLCSTRQEAVLVVMGVLE